MTSNTRGARNVAQIGDEAGEWLQRLGSEHDPDDPIPDPLERRQALLSWLQQSPTHVRIFFEMMRVERLVRGAAAIRLTEPPPLVARPAPATRRNYSGFALAVSFALGVSGAIWFAVTSGAHTYVTAVGEQRPVELADGSRMTMNTNSRAKVVFSDRARHVELLQGEALFEIRHDPRRPFVVSSADTDIQVVGTQFDVRRSDRETRVAVLEGVVQIATSTPTRLSAGDLARVAGGQVTTEKPRNIGNAILWRQRRLLFSATPLAEVAAEFNRYNRTQIRVLALPSGEKPVSGIFDADRPESLIEYALQRPSLRVEHDGNTWIIRPRL